MSVAGLQRHRKLQVGFQTAFASNVPATVVLPYRAAPQINPNLEDPDVDVGSLDPVLAPFAGALELTDTWTGKHDYDHSPALWALILKPVASTGGTAKTYTFQAASLTQDPFAYASTQWGDDVTTDWQNFGGVIGDTFTTGFDEELGAWDVDFGTIASRVLIGGPTGGLSVQESLPWVYGADTEIFLDTAFGSIGTTRLVDNVHTFQMAITANNDPKRFANGSNTRFQIANFGRGAREIEFTLGVAKTAATIAERARIDDAPPALRFLEARATSPEIITGSTPYSLSIRAPVRLISAVDAEFGSNNTGYEFTYRARYNSDLGYAIRAVVVCARAWTFS
jgi:hypothetical protein